MTRVRKENFTSRNNSHVDNIKKNVCVTHDEEENSRELFFHVTRKIFTLAHEKIEAEEMKIF